MSVECNKYCSLLSYLLVTEFIGECFRTSWALHSKDRKTEKVRENWFIMRWALNFLIPLQHHSTMSEINLWIFLSIIISFAAAFFSSSSFHSSFRTHCVLICKCHGIIASKLKSRKWKKQNKKNLVSTKDEWQCDKTFKLSFPKELLYIKTKPRMTTFCRKKKKIYFFRM